MRKNNQLLYLIISLFVLTIALIGSNFYHTWTTNQINETVAVQILPIEPSFNTAVINNLKSRQQIEPNFEVSSASQPAFPSPTPTPRSASSGATLTITPSATTSATPPPGGGR